MADDNLTWDANYPGIGSSSMYMFPHYQDIYNYNFNYLNNSGHTQVTVGIAAKVILGISYSLAIVICGIGNLLLCCSLIRFRRMRTTTNLLIGNIALSDFIVAAVCTPFKLYYYMAESWPFGNIMCVLVAYGTVTSLYVSVNSLLLIAIDRYNSIMFPLRPRMSRNTLSCCVFIIWVVSLTVAIPTATTTVTTTMYELNEIGDIISNYTMCWESNWTNHTLMSFYTILLLIVEFIIPLGLMSFAYFSIAKKLWFRHVPGGFMTQHQEMVMEKTKRRTIRMLIIVVTLFAVCWAPYHGYAINRDFIMPSFQGERTKNFFATFYIVEALAMSNSVFNTIIYIVINANFRMAAMQMVLPKSLWKKEPSVNAYVRYQKCAQTNKARTGQGCGVTKDRNMNCSSMTSSTCLNKDRSPNHKQIDGLL